MCWRCFSTVQCYQCLKKGWIQNLALTCGASFLWNILEALKSPLDSQCLNKYSCPLPSACHCSLHINLSSFKSTLEDAFLNCFCVLLVLLLLEEKWQSIGKTNWGIPLSRQEGQKLPSASIKTFYQYLFRSLTSGLACKLQVLSPALRCHMAHIAPDSCEIPPAGLSKQSKSRTRCLQQLQGSRERSHCRYLRLLKCFQSLSCARHHRIYAELVFSFLLKLTRNPPMSLSRVNKLNKLTILFTFS